MQTLARVQLRAKACASKIHQGKNRHGTRPLLRLAIIILGTTLNNTTSSSRRSRLRPRNMRMRVVICGVRNSMLIRIKSFSEGERSRFKTHRLCNLSKRLPQMHSCEEKLSSRSCLRQQWTSSQIKVPRTNSGALPSSCTRLPTRRA